MGTFFSIRPPVKEEAAMSENHDYYEEKLARLSQNVKHSLGMLEQEICIHIQSETDVIQDMLEEIQGDVPK